MAKYMPSLSLYQHRMTLLCCDERFEGARDEESYMAAKETLEREAEELTAGHRGQNKSIRPAARYASKRNTPRVDERDIKEPGWTHRMQIRLHRLPRNFLSASTTYSRPRN